MENHSMVEGTVHSFYITILFMLKLLVAFALSMPMVMIEMDGVVEEDGIEEMEAEAGWSS